MTYANESHFRGQSWSFSIMKFKPLFSFYALLILYWFKFINREIHMYILRFNLFYEGPNYIWPISTDFELKLQPSFVTKPALVLITIYIYTAHYNFWIWETAFYKRDSSKYYCVKRKLKKEGDQKYILTMDHL